MRKHLLILVVSLGLSLVLIADDAAKESRPQVADRDMRVQLGIDMSRLRTRLGSINPRPPVQQAMKDLFSATTHEQLQALIPKWKTELPRGLRNELIRSLLRKMRSRDEVKFIRPQNMALLISPYFSTDEFHRVHELQKEGKPVAAYAHDIYMEGGRCAWALSRLLHLRLFAVCSPMTDEQMASAVSENTFLVIESMNVPDEMDFEHMTVEQRRLLAVRTRNHEVLSRMVVDADTAVRGILARRLDLGYVDENLLQAMWNDKDADIAATARKTYFEYINDKLSERPFPDR